MRRDGSFPEGELQYVLGVYREGKRVATYLAKDLIDNIEMGTRFHPFGGYGFEWLDRNSRYSPWLGAGHLYSEDIIRNGKKEGSYSPIVLHLQTYEGTRYEFDLETGKILVRKVKEPEAKVSVGENPFGPNAE